ncbi:MAG: NAD-dependent epimerase/dehydratase family protein [Byssovorax sp.]
MTYRVALIGAGFIAKWHVGALRAVEGVEVRAVCDKVPGLAEAFARRHDIPQHYVDLDAMLASEHLDAAHVLVPPEAHASVAERVLAAGVDVLIEKPAAPRASEVASLLALAEARGRRAGVSHNFSFDPTVERMIADLRGGRLGAAREVIVTWHRTLPHLVAGPFDAWMLAEPRNLVTEIGPHPLSLLAALDALPDEVRVEVSDPLRLPNGATVYRRWLIEGMRGPVRSIVRIALGAGLQQFGVELRGTLGAAAADLENHTYVRREHTRFGRLGMDTDSAAMAIAEAIQLGSQAAHNLGLFALHKLRVRPEGDWLGLGMARGFERFHLDRGGPIDPRLSLERARDIIALCETIGAAAPRPEPAPAPAAIHARPSAPPEILVLGGSGFIGQALVQALAAEGERARLLVRSPGKLGLDVPAGSIEVMRGDLTQPGDLRAAMRGIKTVIHLARPNVTAWSDYLRYDVEVTRAIGEACLDAKVERLLYTGTIDSYYAGEPGSVITEQTPLDPEIDRRNEYARAKAMGEEVLLDFHRRVGLPLVILRPGIVIGKGPLPLHPGVAAWSPGRVCRLYGDGHNKLPLVLVDDVARGLVLAMRAPGIEGESFNLIGDPLLSAREYVAAVEARAGMRFEVIPTPIPEIFAVDLFKFALNFVAGKPELRVPSYRDEQSRTQLARFDCTKAKETLGWQPERDRDALIRRGIHEAVDLVYR